MLSRKTKECQLLIPAERGHKSEGSYEGAFVLPPV